MILWPSSYIVSCRPADDFIVTTLKGLARRREADLGDGASNIRWHCTAVKGCKQKFETETEKAKTTFFVSWDTCCWKEWTRMKVKSGKKRMRKPPKKPGSHSGLGRGFPRHLATKWALGRHNDCWKRTRTRQERNVERRQFAAEAPDFELADWPIFEQKLDIKDSWPVHYVERMLATY